MNYIFEYPVSALLYYSIGIIVTMLAYTAAKSSKKGMSNFSVVAIIIILSVFSGLRGFSVGTDTSNYVYHINSFQSGVYYQYKTEPGLLLVALVAKQVIEGPVFTLLILSFIINVLIVSRLWSFRNRISFEFSIFIYYFTYYIMTFSGVRQWVAIAIVFYSLKYLLEESYFKFSIFVIAASLFHNTALISYLLLLISLLPKLKDAKLDFRKTLIGSTVLVLLAIIVETNFQVISKYSSYITNLEWRGSTGVFFWVKVVIAVYMYYNLFKGDFLNDRENKKLFDIYIVSLALSMPGYFFENIFRLSLYFLVIEIIVYSMAFNFVKNKKGKILILAIALVTILKFTLELYSSGFSLMPYLISI